MRCRLSAIGLQSLYDTTDRRSKQGQWRGVLLHCIIKGKVRVLWYHRIARSEIYPEDFIEYMYVWPEGTPMTVTHGFFEGSHEPTICAVFGCGRTLSGVEAMAGKVCIHHSMPQGTKTIT